ncbi:hypothetical protein ACS0TY_027952 [Phlomoides rotata]
MKKESSLASTGVSRVYFSLRAKLIISMGIFLSIQPISQDVIAISIQPRHCFQLSLSVPANLPNNSTITTCRRIMIPITIQNSLFLVSISKMFLPFTLLNVLKIWQRTSMLKIKVSFSLVVNLKDDSPSNCIASISCMRLSAGSSIERARTSNVPTISFTHNI